MAIASLDGLIAANKQKVMWNKNTMSNVAAAGVWTSTWNMAGVPPAGSITPTAVSGSATTQAFTGARSFASAAATSSIYISNMTFGASQVGTWRLYDRMWFAGALTPVNGDYASVSSNGQFNRNSAQFSSLELWCETATTLGAATYNQRINYTDSDGTTYAGNVTLAQTAAPNMVQVSTTGKGIKAILSASGNTAGTGTFNVLVLRPLVEVNIDVANVGVVRDFTQTGLPEIHNNACLFWAWYGTTATEPNFWCTMELATG